MKLKLVSKKSAKILGKLAKDVLNQSELLRNQLIAAHSNAIPKQISQADADGD